MIRLFKHYIPHAVVLLWLVDILLLVAANETSWRLRAGQIGMELAPAADRLLPHFAFAAVISMSMVAVGVYGAEALRSMRFAAARLLVAISLGVIALSFADFLLSGHTFWRSTLAYSMALAVVLMIGNRLILGMFLGTSAFRRRVLVLGAGERAARLRLLGERPESGFAIVGYIAMSDGVPVIEEAIPRGAISNLTRYVENLGVSEVVLALEERRNALPLKDLLRVKTTGVHVNEFSSFLERETGRVDLDTVNPSWLIFSDGFSSGRAISGAAKRLFDITVSLILLVVSAPVILLFALLVKIDSRGPAFYRQPRVGRFGEPFDVIKLRSMRVDAEAAGAQWASKDDPRVTRMGRFIRKVRIDELPQAWTVLKGEMSFVGPRPERPEFVADLEQQLRYYAERHMVKPGITGWAQINYPYGASIEDSRHKLEYDLYYAKNYTLFLDFLIILQTLRVILWSEGAR
ncbi:MULTISPECIES: TIGR03013 family XrtA/PEP-CTERM system glycosyltransferase [Novosphingobium]|jgi:sugar transferase (PEP-CTERM system associated)|uniref:Sugar transferase, PEP-CTERM system associated/exopolysaccharide biosynthesis polyprenyl glycosylphosphotransferase n=1 Tax=Novosphingobium panipatense TaxID=428991 RepID=A0ABY1Q0W8_9SPHN|nr:MULTISPECIES: TIGR03013 family XrtA/PEP-CTERM system glycosyltransferase [Novosphingobium]SMP55889.1 sugar transferase, PEP-CTERM system associated/exopolysaccharide biosynthesis polyprenyl glycosylphosphotransferase [Novosphingobium panipatense]